MLALRILLKHYRISGIHMLRLLRSIHQINAPCKISISSSKKESCIRLSVKTAQGRRPLYNFSVVYINQLREVSLSMAETSSTTIPKRFEPISQSSSKIFPASNSSLPAKPSKSATLTAPKDVRKQNSSRPKTASQISSPSTPFSPIFQVHQKIPMKFGDRIYLEDNGKKLVLLDLL